jgi:capsule polysaccharide export protein KpsE/RkpR
MSAKQTIKFQESSTSAKDFVHELNDPEMLRNRRIPPRASIELRRQQVARLRDNITVLVSKREEFNRKMEDYIQNLRSLIRSIEKGIAAELKKLPGEGAGAAQGTLVRCLGCESEEVFQRLQVIFARESSESFTVPTEVYVLDGDVLKKGHFACALCGTDGLVIRAV